MRTALEGQSDFLVSAPTSAVFCRSSLTRMKLNFLSDLTGDADSVRTVVLLETLDFDLRTGVVKVVLDLTRELTVEVTVERAITHAIALWMTE